MQPEPATNEGIDVYAFADNARKLILENPRNYIGFGMYWFLVKALLKKVYPQAEVPLLGDHVDQAVVERMPKGPDLGMLLEMAANEYAMNVGLGTPADRLEDEDGEFFTLMDPDMGG